MRSRFFWIVIVLVIMLLIIGLCASCGYLASNLSDLEEYISDNEIPQELQDEVEFEEKELERSENLPTPALKVNIPAFEEGELPVGAVVQILVEGLVEGYIESWSGSGTIISPEGLILTNAHVAVGDRFYRADRLTIAFTIAEDEPPVPAYMAEVVQAYTALDIAVLRIAYDLNGQRINPTGLDLPFVQLGDSDALRLGDSITILGYPGIGGETITLTRGEVSGFTAEAGHGNRAFIKTSATIAGGNSGGLATDENNRLIGIPTQVGAGERTGEIVDCRPLADTNRDGYVDDYDTCVPTGGFINALRPINLAMPLIDAAREGKQVASIAELPDVELLGQSTVIYSDDFSDPGTRWPVGENNNTAYYYDNGRYFVEVKSSNNWQYIYGGLNLDKVIISIDSLVEQSTGDGDYGVICRYDNFGNYYYFSITQDGFFSISKSINDEDVFLVEYTYLDLLDNLSTATLQAACIGDTLSFAVNGKLLAEVTDDSISAGDYGFFAGTFDQGGNIISFDNLTVSQP